MTTLKSYEEETLLWSFGCNDDGQLGVGVDNEAKEKRELVHLLPPFANCPIASVDCGSRHTLALSVNGEVYAWGWGAMGQLGHGDGKSYASPQVIKSFVQAAVVIREISAGGCHSGAVDESGNAYTWGNSSYGQLGHAQSKEDLRRVTVPIRLSIDLKEPQDKIVNISCGGTHTAVLTDMGRLYTWGRADSGQIGDGKRWIECKVLGNPAVREPTLIEALGHEKLVQVECGAFHTAAITEKGDLFMWGKEDYGMTGVNQSGDVFLPTKIDTFSTDTVRHVSCGGWHTAAVMKSGDCCTFGRGEYGRLGLSDCRSRGKPEKIRSLPNHKIVEVSCGGTHTLFLTDNGSVYSVGRPDDGRLGHRGKLNIPAKVVLPHIQPRPTYAVSAGGAHSMVLCRTMKPKNINPGK